MSTDFNNINDFVRRAVEDTIMIYGPLATPDKLVLFSDLLKDKTVDDLLNSRAYMVGNNNERYIAFTSSGDIPTNNIRYALVASGISPHGLLPDKKCYTNSSLATDEKVVEQAKEYRQKTDEIEFKINNIYNWLQSNERATIADPNVFELVEIFTKVNNINLVDSNISKKSENQLREIWENRKNNFINNGIGTDNLSYQICSDCYDGALSGQYIDLASIKALQKMAAIDLWLKQEKRNGTEIYYNNDYELFELGNYINASKMVGMNLDLYINSFIQEINMSKLVEEVRTR